MRMLVIVFIISRVLLTFNDIAVIPSTIIVISGPVFRGAGSGRERVASRLSIPDVDAVYASHLHDLIHRPLPQLLHPRLLHQQGEISQGGWQDRQQDRRLTADHDNYKS